MQLTDENVKMPLLTPHSAPFAQIPRASKHVDWELSIAGLVTPTLWLYVQRVLPSSCPRQPVAAAFRSEVGSRQSALMDGMAVHI